MQQIGLRCRRSVATGGAADVSHTSGVGNVTARIAQVVAPGREGADDVNVWLVGDDRECLVVDAAGDPAAIEAAVAGRHVVAIACTHGHATHVEAARDLAARVGAPVLLHPDDRALWDAVHPGHPPHAEIADGETLTVAGIDLWVLHTPGHTPGACCFFAPALGVVFTGDTLPATGPGPSTDEDADPEALVESVRERLARLPAATGVHPGHGQPTTIGLAVAELAR